MIYCENVVKVNFFFNITTFPFFFFLNIRHKKRGKKKQKQKHNSQTTFCLTFQVDKFNIIL